MRYQKTTCIVINNDDVYEVATGYEVEGQEYWNEFLDWNGTLPPRLFVYKCNTYRWAVADLGSGAVIPYLRKKSGQHIIVYPGENTRDDRVRNAIEHIKHVGAEKYVKAISKFQLNYPKPETKQEEAA